MDRSAMLTLLVHVLLLLSHSALRLAALDLPWQDRLCCESTPTSLTPEDVHVSNSSASTTQPGCSYSNSSSPSPEESFAGTCLDILCTVDAEWQNLMCDLQTGPRPSAWPEAGVVAVSLQRQPATEVNPVVCEAQDSFRCSVPLDDPAGFSMRVSLSVSGSVAPTVLLEVPARPVKPSPPTNLSHVQTIDGELMLQWHRPPHQSNLGPLRYQVRYSANASHPSSQVASTLGDEQLPLDLKPLLKYSVQVRCSTLEDPPLWSHWSDSHQMKLYEVSYVPELVVVRPGQNVTVYCVINDRSANASSAVWRLNMNQTVQQNQYRVVNQRVSQVTVRSSETKLDYMLQCRPGSPYSQIYVQGASIDIHCETNGHIDAMECSFNNTGWFQPKFRSRLAQMQCDKMQEEEEEEEEGAAAEETVEEQPNCRLVDSTKTTCTIENLSMNCYKLWLEVKSPLGHILSKPVYLTARDHVKPNPPSDVKAISRINGVLEVSWNPPLLPTGGLQCQFRYHSPSTMRAQPDWTEQSPVRESRAQVAVWAMCSVYVVQVRCKHVKGFGYWSEWSGSVYSSPDNSGAPERGPDFWRILQDHPNRPQTKVTLLFKEEDASGLSYCVDGFLIQHWSSTGSVTTERIEPASSFSFDWDQKPQNVTVMAYNSLGNSSSNSYLVLDRQPKRRCLRSFSVQLVNRSCAALTWTLLENCCAPHFMVVQWSSRRHQGSAHHRRLQGGDSWARLPYSGSPAYLEGEVFDSEDEFWLHPVFADGEGEPVFATAKRGEAAVHQMLLIVFFLSVVLFVTLIISQQKMKKFVWKEVPDPNKCSWARGVDFRRVDPLDHMFRPADGLPAWPLLLLPPENISKLVVVDKVDLSALNVDVAQDPVPADPLDSEADCLQPLPAGEPQFVLDLEDPARKENSTHSLVTYSTVLLHDPRQQQQQQRYKDGSGSSSSDEGNFSANNSDISGSFQGGLWELDDPRRSCSFNSVEKLSEASEQEDEGPVRGEKDLFYLGVEGYPGDESEEEEGEEEEEEEEDETDTELLKNVPGREGRPAVSHPLLGGGISSEPPPSSYSFSPFYLPQFRTQSQDGRPQ